MIKTESNRTFEFRLSFDKETKQLVLSHTPFNYENSHGIFMRVNPLEACPLFMGNVILMGLKNQLVLERFNVGIIAAPGRRSNMEDNFIVCHDLHVHESLQVSLYAVLDGHGALSLPRTI